MIITNEARCRDCYRCLRACPVKAIRFVAGEETGALYARVIDDLCVKDARCVLACPQKAKKVSTSLAEVRDSIARGNLMAASVAPSFMAGFPLAQPGQMPSLLRKLGFSKVQETSIGAALVAREHVRIGFEQPLISSACPVIVNLVEMHFPDALPYLAPIVSPMIAHGRYLKGAYPGCHTVFIGPCAAKKDEAKDDGINDAVDFVLGFDELWEWAQSENIDLNHLAPGEFDGAESGLARLFPIDGGLLKAVNAQGQEGFFTVSGLQNCMEFIKHISSGSDAYPGLVELLACRGGCINGPHMCNNEDLFSRRRKVIEYHKSKSLTVSPPGGAVSNFDVATGIESSIKPSIKPSIEASVEMLHRSFTSRKITFPQPDDAEIKGILEQTGKNEPEDELNCGACGYESCRDKAVAVHQGNAELEMCIPYMRKRAESMSNRVLGAMPNAVVITDNELIIQEANPAAGLMLNCPARELVGQSLSAFIDTVNFAEVLQTGKMVNKINNYEQLGNKIAREIIFPLESRRIIVGILVDITEEKRRLEQYELVKGQTIARAQEVITKQMTVAQEIAGLLGETTAETKVLLTNLIDLMQKERF